MKEKHTAVNREGAWMEYIYKVKYTYAWSEEHTEHPWIMGKEGTGSHAGTQTCTT